MGQLASARQAMVAEQIVKRGVTDQRVVDALLRVPRHVFVPPANRVHAYSDGALTIGQGQTISQPYIVAAMTEALHLRPDSNVLEIGTGSGYQTAVLAEIAQHVFTVERMRELSNDARQILEELGYSNITFLIGDGTLGWPEHAPYDAIIVTAGAPAVPDELRLQVSPAGGVLLIPVGDRDVQELTRYTRNGDSWESENLMSCRFVPLVGEEGWSD